MPKTRRDTHAPIARSMSTFQRMAHDLLSEEGWSFVRRTGKGANTYQHPDGRRTNVIATPRNEGDALDYLKQAIKSPRQAIRPGTRELDTPQKEATVPTTTEKTDALVALADNWLRTHVPAGRRETLERAAAFQGWVRRCIEHHGPMPALQLEEAAHTMGGFSSAQCTKARKDLGVRAWREGTREWMIGFDSQVPHGVSAYQRADQAPEHPIGDNNGQGPEPREEPTLKDRVNEAHSDLIAHAPELDDVEPDTSPLTDAERAAVAMGGVIRDVPDDPRDAESFDDRLAREDAEAELAHALPPPSWPPELPFAPTETERARELYERPANPEVIAAVQMLMESVGMKPQDPALLRLAAEADAALQVALGQLSELDALLAAIKARLS